MDDVVPEVLFQSFYLYCMCLNATLHNIVGMTLLDEPLGVAHKLSIPLNLGLYISRKEEIKNISTISTQSWKKEDIVQI